MGLQGYLLLSSALFCFGFYGILSRKNAIGILLSVELMANAVNINLVAFSHFSGEPTGYVFTLFTMAITVAEVVIGLSLVILLFRSKKNILVAEANALRN